MLSWRRGVKAVRTLAAAKGPRVMVVDDDQVIHRILSKRLGSNGYEVMNVSDGREALHAFRSFAPDILILDVMMPGENGYRISRAIKMLACQIPGFRTPKIIIATARNLADDREREETMLLYSKADAMMYKPLDLDRLMIAVNELTRKTA